MNEQEAYYALQRASGIKVGDTVKVLRKAKDYEMGWSGLWLSSMDKYVGQTLQVTHMNDTHGVVAGMLSLAPYYFPFFVLEVVAPPSIEVKLNDSYTARVFADRIVVGCQTFDVRIARNLLEAVDKMKHEELQKMKKYLDEVK